MTTKKYEPRKKGRPPSGNRMHVYPVNMSDKQAQQARDIGEGNLSFGVRIALDEHNSTPTTSFQD